MEIKILDNNEYDLLKSTPDGELFTPENSIVIVAVNGNGVEGRTSLMNLIHLEGTWVAEDKRGTTLGYRLEKAAIDKARELGLKYIHTYSPNDEISDVLSRLGWKEVPVKVFAKEL